MNDEAIRQILCGVFTYFVEIRHPGETTWNHVHGLDWETTEDYYAARMYAKSVRGAEPKARVRIVEKLPNFPTHHIDLV